MDYTFATFSSFNSTRKAVKLLSALDNVKNDFKRPALTMDHISASIIRGVFPKIVRSIVQLTSTQAGHTVIQLCQTLQHIAKVFAPFPFSHVIYTCSLFRVFSLQKEVNENLVAFRFYGGFCFAQFPISLTVHSFPVLKPPIQRHFQ